MVNKEELSDWATGYSTKQFITMLRVEIQNKQQDAMRFTDQDTVVKDYFYVKGVCDGLLEAIGVINDLKRSEK